MHILALSRKTIIRRDIKIDEQENEIKAWYRLDKLRNKTGGRYATQDTQLTCALKRNMGSSIGAQVLLDTLDLDYTRYRMSEWEVNAANLLMTEVRM